MKEKKKTLATAVARILLYYDSFCPLHLLSLSFRCLRAMPRQRQAALIHNRRLQSRRGAPSPVRGGGAGRLPRMIAKEDRE